VKVLESVKKHIDDSSKINRQIIENGGEK